MVLKCLEFFIELRHLEEFAHVWSAHACPQDLLYQFIELDELFGISTEFLLELWCLQEHFFQETPLRLSLLKVLDDLHHEVEKVEPRVDFILEVVFEAIVVEVVDLQHLFFECIEGFFVEKI